MKVSSVFCSIPDLIVVRNPKSKFRSSSSDRTFNSKYLMGDRTLQHICRRTKAAAQSQPAKELQFANTRQAAFGTTINDSFQ